MKTIELYTDIHQANARISNQEFIISNLRAKLKDAEDKLKSIPVKKESILKNLTEEEKLVWITAYTFALASENSYLSEYIADESVLKFRKLLEPRLTK
jgi:hypothetical protein